MSEEYGKIISFVVFIVVEPLEDWMKVPVGLSAEADWHKSVTRSNYSEFETRIHSAIICLQSVFWRPIVLLFNEQHPFYWEHHTMLAFQTNNNFCALLMENIFCVECFVARETNYRSKTSWKWWSSSLSAFKIKFYCIIHESFWMIKIAYLRLITSLITRSVVEYTTFINQKTWPNRV